MNSLTTNAVKLTALSLSSLLFTLSAGATEANRTISKVNAANTVESASPKEGYLIAQVSFCSVQDPTGTPLNVRDKPNGRAVVNRLSKGDTVTAVNSLDINGKRWTFIIPEKGNQGWVLSSYIDCGNPNGTACTVKDPSGTPLNVRKNPNSNDAILGKLSNGEKITGTDYSPDQKWRFVYSQNGLRGWAFAQYVQCS